MALITLFSCTEDGVDFLASDELNVEAEATTDAYFEETDDFSVLAVASDNATLTGGKVQSGGRVIVVNDYRLECAVVEIELANDNALGNPKGTITIDFGDGCEDARGNVRKGKIIITYSGKRFFPESSIVTTFEGYHINGVLIEGVRTVTNTTESVESNPSFNIAVDGGKATWPDGSVATREANRTRVWVRATNPLQDEWRVTGTATGTNRNGNSYTMEITEALVYKRECAISSRIFMAVAGTKVLTAGDRQLTIDYGDGECDRLVTVTINGQSKEIEVKGNV
ncbi:MAG: hypothetical protein RIA63_07080 [Cyclobacteriaceae bacterium]